MLICMLPPHQLSVSTSAAAYNSVTQVHAGIHTPICEQNDRQVQKILPCLKLRLRAVIMFKMLGFQNKVAAKISSGNTHYKGVNIP